MDDGPWSIPPWGLEGQTHHPGPAHPSWSNSGPSSLLYPAGVVSAHFLHFSLLKTFSGGESDELISSEMPITDKAQSAIEVQFSLR